MHRTPHALRAPRSTLRSRTTATGNSTCSSGRASRGPSQQVQRGGDHRCLRQRHAERELVGRAYRRAPQCSVAPAPAPRGRRGRSRRAASPATGRSPRRARRAVLQEAAESIALRRRSPAVPSEASVRRRFSTGPPGGISFDRAARRLDCFDKLRLRRSHAIEADQNNLHPPQACSLPAFPLLAAPPPTSACARKSFLPASSLKCVRPSLKGARIRTGCSSSAIAPGR